MYVYLQPLIEVYSFRNYHKIMRERADAGATSLILRPSRKSDGAPSPTGPVRYSRVSVYMQKRPVIGEVIVV